ncbi:MAG: DUF4097 family beta strand repeat-containing protein [Gemmatimonadales bacterium]
MQARTLLAAVAAAGLCLAGTADLAAQDFEWQGRLAAGRTVEISNINGSITAEPASGNTVQVEAVKHEGRRGDPEDVRIEVVEHEDGVSICAIHPRQRSSRGDRYAECGGEEFERPVTGQNDTEVEFTVRVPAGVHFRGHTVNGDVTAEDMGADAYIHTVNGQVRVSAAGHAEASTVNGSVWASIGRADWRGELEFSTVNGNITIELPDGVGAEVTAGTVNGDIETDFPLTVRGRFGPRRLTGTIGDGGRDLTLSTVNGDITLRRR